MDNADNFYFDDPDSFLDEEEIKTKIKFCKKIIENNEVISNLDLLEDTVHLCLEEGLVDDGLLLANAILEITSYNADIWQFRGILLNNKFEFEEAYFSFLKAIVFNPNDSETLLNKAIAEENLGLWDEAIFSLEKVLAVDYENEDVYYSLGGLFAKKGEFNKAIEYFTKAVQIDKDFAEAWYELGVCYDTIEKFSESLFAYDRYLELEPYNQIGWFNRGIVLIEMGDFEKAVNSYELAIAIREDFPSAWFNLGVCYLSLNKYPLAIDAFKVVVKADPKDEAAWFHIGSAFEEMNDFELAIEAFNKAIILDDEYYEAFLSRGFCFKKINKSKPALRDFDKAISILGEFEKGHELGFSEKEVLDSLNKFESIVITTPNDLKAWNILGELYLKLGEYSKSMAAFDNCLRIDSRNANAYYAKAKVNFLLHNVEEAFKILKLAFSLDPNTKQKFENDFPAVKVSKLFNKLLNETSQRK